MLDILNTVPVDGQSAKTVNHSSFNVNDFLKVPSYFCTVIVLKDQIYSAKRVSRIKKKKVSNWRDMLSSGV